MIGVASAATSAVIGHVAAGTRTIRVGAGSIMLPNRAPLPIAEQSGTLEALFPGGAWTLRRTRIGCAASFCRRRRVVRSGARRIASPPPHVACARCWA